MRKMRSSGKTRCSVCVERARRREIAAERLLDDHPRVRRRSAGLRRAARSPSGTCWAGSPGSGAGAGPSPSSRLQPREGRRVVVVAVDVAQRGSAACEGAPRRAAAVLGDGSPARARSSWSRRPARLGHPDDGKVEAPAARQRLQRREDLLVGEVSGRAEEDQRVGAALLTLRRGPIPHHERTIRDRAIARGRRLVGRRIHAASGPRDSPASRT